MPEFLLELYSEEIPPKLQISARKELKLLLVKALEEECLKYKSISTYSSPTRLTILITEIPEKVKILSKENENLEFVAERYLDTYSKATPFPHVVFENFFDKNFLNKVLDEFPDLSKTQNSQVYMNKNEIKYANNDYDNFPSSIKSFFDFLNSDYYLKFLQKITATKEKLVADTELNGGGLHEIKKGGILKIHTDFNKHPNLDLDRRVNVLIYLNKKWEKNYGGNLELWDRNMKSCDKKILPIFNTMVVFSTNDFSNHGHPQPVSCPSNISRKSIALYYFSKGRPKEELNSNT